MNHQFVVSAFIVHDYKVLLVNHKKLETWLPPSGHVEPTEDTDQAIAREIKEETGLIFGKDVIEALYHPHVYNRLMDTTCHNRKNLMRPWAMEVHDYPKEPIHRHICLVYLFRALTDKVVLNDREHNDIGWFDLARMQASNLLPSIHCYAAAALGAPK